MAYNRYINKFPTNVEFEKYINCGLAEVPNTALIDDTGEMKYTRKLPNDYIFYGTTKGTTDFMIGRSVSSGTADCIKVHVVPSTDGSDNIMYANKEDVVKTPFYFYPDFYIDYSNEITSIKKWKIDTSNVSEMRGMFSSCSSLTSLDLSNFDTSKVTDMCDMFYSCSSLTSLDLSNFDTSNVTNMNNMFSNCERLTSLDLSNFDTSKATIGSYVLANCSKLTSLKLSASFFNSSMDNYYYFRDLTSWTEATSLSQFVNAISSKDGTGKTVNLSDATKTALTDAQKMQIRDAKWTIA